MRLIFAILSCMVAVVSWADDWKQETSPKLNFFEIDGYFRTRGNLLRRCDLGTYVPADRGVTPQGTSGCPVPGSYNATENAGKNSADRPGTLLWGDMRLRLEPTLNVTEDIRIKGQVDVFDNMVLGQAMGLYPSYSYPYSFLTTTTYSPPGLLTVKRAWAEIDTPAGELRFGRMPINWGLGLLYNAGNQITNDYGDNVDGAMFATQLWGHYVIPGFFVSYVGQTQRGGGMGSLGDNSIPYQPQEWGQRYNLDPSDDAYTVFLSIAKKDKPADIEALLADDRWVLNYGVMGSYRFQINDYRWDLTTNKLVLQYRDSHAGFLSLWADYYVDKFHLEGEAVGLVGRIGNSQGLWLSPIGTALNRSDPLSILQGGVAVRSRYGFMANKLGVGFDLGWASGDSAYGMGARPGIRSTEKGDADGQQFSGSDTSINNFRFSPDYRIDLILFREIIGTVTDVFYLRPHIGYNLSRSFAAELTAISSFTNFAESTPGQSHLLGLEFDANLSYHTEQGIYAMFQYGLLIPFAGLNHSSDQLQNNKLMQDFGTARLAQAFQLFAGIAF